MAKKNVPTHQHPLDWFLDQSSEFGPQSNLDFLAQEYAQQPFNAEQLRVELREKLNRLHYPQPDHEHPVERPTFANVLEKAEVLCNLLSDDTLRELWKSLLLKKIFERSRELDDKKQSVRGVPITEHWRRIREIIKDIETFKKLADKYDLEKTLPQLDKMNRKIPDEFIPIVFSGRRVHGRELLTFSSTVPEWKTKLQRRGRQRRVTGSAAQRPVPAPRIEEKRIQALIYVTLEQRLQTRKTYKNGIEDIFLCQLAELVWASADVQGLSSGESLRRDINRWRTI
jgi:hypothetical protein